MCASLDLASPPSVTTSSRTDRGVHALCNSVHTDLQHQSVPHLTAISTSLVVVVVVVVVAAAAAIVPDLIS